MSDREKEGEKARRVLVTDGATKHAIAIQDALHAAEPGLELWVHAGASRWMARLGGPPGRRLLTGSLEDCLRRGGFDQVIPVGGKAVSVVAKICPEKAVLPPLATIERCLDKLRVHDLATEVGVPSPNTWGPESLEEALQLDPGFPCVIKSRDETSGKFVFYARSRAEYELRCREAFDRCAAQENWRPLIQSFVEGEGVGFFGLYQEGKAKRIFMHRRIREWPISGGASTAAAAFWHDALKVYGMKILDALEWHGVAMVEFKWDRERDRLHLIEINPKFWGSTELSLRAGVDFPGGLRRVFEGETLEYSEDFERDLEFYWPLPDDLRALRKRGELGKIREYFGPNAATNLLRHPLLDGANFLRLLRRGA